MKQHRTSDYNRNWAFSRKLKTVKACFFILKWHPISKRRKKYLKILSFSSKILREEIRKLLTGYVIAQAFYSSVCCKFFFWYLFWKPAELHNMCKSSEESVKSILHIKNTVHWTSTSGFNNYFFSITNIQCCYVVI